MQTSYIEIPTKGNTDVIDITREIEKVRAKHDVRDGILFLSVIGSTAALTTMEYEPGQVKDMKSIFEQLIPYRDDWQHNFTWNDDNGHSHLRSSLLKTGLFVSVTGAKLDVGTWQQIVLVDFDTRPRKRRIVVKIIT